MMRVQCRICKYVTKKQMIHNLYIFCYQSKRFQKITTGTYNRKDQIEEEYSKEYEIKIK